MFTYLLTANGSGNALKDLFYLSSTAPADSANGFKTWNNGGTTRGDAGEGDEMPKKKITKREPDGNS